METTKVTRKCEECPENPAYGLRTNTCTVTDKDGVVIYEDYDKTYLCKECLIECGLIVD